MDPVPVGLYSLRLCGRTELSSTSRSDTSGLPRPGPIATDRTTNHIVRGSALVAGVPRYSIARAHAHGAEEELRSATRGRARQCRKGTSWYYAIEPIPASFARPEFQRRKDRPEHQVKRLFARWRRRVSNGFVRSLSARDRSSASSTSGHSERTTDGHSHACERRGQRLLSAARSRPPASDHQGDRAHPAGFGQAYRVASAARCCNNA